MWFTEAFPIDSVYSPIYTESNIIALIGRSGTGKSTYVSNLMIRYIQQKGRVDFDVVTATGYHFDYDAMDTLLSYYKEDQSHFKHLFLIIDDAHFLSNAGFFNNHLPNKRIHVILQSQGITDSLYILQTSVDCSSVFMYFQPAGSHYFVADGYRTVAVEPYRAALPSAPARTLRAIMRPTSVQCNLGNENMIDESKWSSAYRAKLRRKLAIRGPLFLQGCSSSFIAEETQEENEKDVSNMAVSHFFSKCNQEEEVKKVTDKSDSIKDRWTTVNEPISDEEIASWAETKFDYWDFSLGSHSLGLQEDNWSKVAARDTAQHDDTNTWSNLWY